MPAIVTCPSCNVTLKPKTPLPAGARVKCPKCQNPFVVPADDEAVAPALPRPKPAAPKPAAAPLPKPKPAPPPEEEDVAEAAAAADEAEDGVPAAPAAGGGFKERLKKVPMWGWIVGGVAVLFLMCGCCGLPVTLYETGMFGGGLLGGGNVTMANYKQLKKGMTEDEVKKVMGGGPSTTSEIGGVHSAIWKGSGEDFITVQFSKDGKAQGGGFQISEGAAKMSGGGPLP